MIGVLLLTASLHLAASDPAVDFIRQQIAAHAGQSGAYVLDTGEEALIARAWLADHAQQSIEVQYFIWSTDNIGILAAESLLRAAERGVRVRILVDDLLIDAPPKSLLALAAHPNIDIRIYNPKVSVGVTREARLLNVATDFHGVNQRMHDKMFIADGTVAITGGRNMAAEYYDYNHEYNFRDRDALVVGEVVKPMRASFERFWASPMSVSVEEILGKKVRVDDAEVRWSWRGLHVYAASKENFAPEVRAAIDGAPRAFPRLAREMVWGEVDFVHDVPGKRGGMTTAALRKLVESAREQIVIQTPYLVMSDEALALFRQVRARGVRVRISTNSLASTDNLQVFSGYRNQRRELLRMGIEIHEYRPDVRSKRSVSGLHAKSMVVDSKVVFIGTFNLDPRSQNLNTEVGVIVRDAALARQVEAAIETDMKPGHSWNAATDNPDQYVPLVKRSKVHFWQMTPIKPLL